MLAVAEMDKVQSLLPRTDLSEIKEPGNFCNWRSNQRLISRDGDVVRILSFQLQEDLGNFLPLFKSIELLDTPRVLFGGIAPLFLGIPSGAKFLWSLQPGVDHG